MTEPVKRKVRVIKAEYVPEAESILMVGECQEGRFRQQIHKNCFKFGNKDVATEMTKLAELMIGKQIFMVFDPDLNDKIEDNYPLKY
jgi:hypothetical protein